MGSYVNVLTVKLQAVCCKFHPYLPYTPLSRKKHTIMAKNNSYRRYGLANFILDVLLTIFTGGFWLIWIFCRELRR